jgi:hypothetical protein
MASKTVVVFGRSVLYKPDGTLWYLESGKGIRLDKPIGTKTKQGYLQCTIGRKQKKVHHLVWFIHKGFWPSHLDHINKNKSDNRIENLREGASINNHNRDMPMPASGLAGCHWSKAKRKYKSSIKVSGKSIFLGYFDSPEEAHKAYTTKKEEILHG